MSCYKFGEAYKPVETYCENLSEGVFEATIVSVNTSQTNTGEEMLEISLNLEDRGMIKHYLVDDRIDELSVEVSNKRITQFFDCFAIERGEFDTSKWLGLKGKVRIAKKENSDDQYYEIKKLFSFQYCSEWLYKEGGQITEKDSFRSFKKAYEEKQMIKKEDSVEQCVCVKENVKQAESIESTEEEVIF